MSSDYIPRLRSELLRAGASRQASRRWTRVSSGLRPLAAAAAVALVVVAVVLALPDGRSDEAPVEQTAGTLRLGYRIEPSGAGAAEQAAQVMRERLAAAGVAGARVTVAPSGDLTIAAPAAARADVAALAQPGRLAFYDWERSVLGPDGKPAPANAGELMAVSRGEAEARAARRPDARVVRAPAPAADGWFALGGDPAMTGADVASAGSGADRMTQEPIVTLEFTARGQSEFETLTRRLAHRGSARAAAGVSERDANQHFAIVLDDRIMAVPYIGFREAPDGLDGSSGAQISGGLTAAAVRRMAAILSTGPLPAALEPTGAARAP